MEPKGKDRPPAPSTTPTKRKKDVASRTDSGLAGSTPKSPTLHNSSVRPSTRSAFVNSPQVRKVLGQPKRVLPSPDPVGTPSPPRTVDRSSSQSSKNESTPKKPTRRSTDTGSKNYLDPDSEVKERKIIELRNEIQVLRTLTLERDRQITQLDETVSSLRIENQKYQSEALKAQKHNGDIQQSFSKKYRGSLSRLEAHLDEHSNESSARIDALTNKHKTEIEEIKLSMAKKQEEWSDLIDAKNADISTLNGRLEEARNSRQSTLDEMKILSKHYNNSIKQMEDAMHVLLKKYQSLQKEKDNIVQNQSQTEEKLRKSISEKFRLSNRLEVASNETNDKQKKIEELDSIVTRLEESLNSLDKQKSQFFESTKEYLEKEHRHDMECGSAKTLKDQLEKCQSLLDSTKDSLIIQRQKSRELEKSNDQLDKQLASVKVDLRIVTRERNELETKLSKETQENLNLASKCSQLQTQRTEAHDKANQFEQIIGKLESKCAEDADLIVQYKCKASEKEQEARAIQEKINQLETDHAKSLAQIGQLEVAAASLGKKDDKIQEQERILQSKDRKISDLRTNIKVLKDACIVLEDQLKEFEGAIVQKCALINELTDTKAKYTKAWVAARDDLEAVHYELRAAVDSKILAEKKFSDLEKSINLVGSKKDVKIYALTEKVALFQKLNSNLSDQLDMITSRYTEAEATRLCISKVLDNQRSENLLIKEQASRQITSAIELKEDNAMLVDSLNDATRKVRFCESELQALQTRLVTLSRENHENEIKFKATVDQQSKLIEYLQHQNESLSKKKKTIAEMIFGREKEGQAQSSAITHNNVVTPNEHPHPDQDIFQYDIKYQNHLETACVAQPEALVTVQKEDCILLQLSDVLTKLSDSSTKGVSKSLIFKQDGAQKLYVNCVKHVFDDLYLFGCEDGLYATRSVEDSNYPIKIDGVGSIHHIEFITNINYALVTEGKDRRLGLVHLGLLRTCVEATQSSKPKIKLQMLADQDSCDLLRVGRTSSDQIVLVVATMKTLNILFWEKDSFVQKLSLRTPQSVTCIVITPSSVIYGSDKIFELDLNNFTVEEFLDEADESLLYVKTTCRNSANYPVAILDVSLDSPLQGQAKPGSAREYLLCFSDVGIFTDSFGRRSRELEVVWSKLPVDVAYKSPDLFILHFGSVEIIRLTAESYTKEKAGEILSNIPQSRNIQLSSPRLLGMGKRQTSVYVGCFSKDQTTVYEVSRALEDKN